MAKNFGQEAMLFTIGFEEEQIRSYIKNQEQLDSHGYDEKGEF